MKAAVFGSGTMGAGIAELFASYGHTVLLYASSIPSAQGHREKMDARLDSRVAGASSPRRKSSPLWITSWWRKSPPPRMRI